jgi:PAS domain S-box-containing protein
MDHMENLALAGDTYRERLERIQRAGNIGDWSLDMTTNAVSASAQTFRILGLDRDAVLTPDVVLAAVHGDDRDLARKAWLAALRDGTCDARIRLVSRGTEKRVRVCAEIQRDAAGRALRAHGTVQDIGAHRHDPHALPTAQTKAAEARVQLVLDSCADGLFGTDANGAITFVNPAACRLLGYAEQELVGRNAHLMLHHSRGDGMHYPASQCPMVGVLASGATIRADEEVFWRADLRPLAVAYTARPVRDRGEIVGAVVSFSDVAVQREIEAARWRTLAEAERLAQARSDFLANVSHEMRTPLNAILGFAQLGVRDSQGRRSGRTFAHIQDSGQMLLALIDDILDFSKIEAGKVALEQIPFDLGRTIDRAANVVAARAFAKGLDFRIEEAPDLPTTCRGDSLRLAQVLTNLLSNAVKFTPNGRILLSMRRDAGSENGVVFEVRDNGIGMTPEQVSRLFRPFEQADASTSRRFGGTGLGLSIAHRLVNLMGGSMAVESTSGQGSVFTVWLPLDAVAQEPRDAGPLRIVLCGLPRNEEIQVCTALQARGISVATAAIDAALSAAGSGDLVVLECAALQEGHAIAAAEAAVVAGRRLVIVCTPGGTHELPDALAGRLHVLERPLRARHAIRAALDAPATPVEQQEWSGKRLAGLRVLAADDSHLNRLVVEEMLSLEGAQPTLVEDGEQALALMARVGPGSFDAVLTDIQMPNMDGYELCRRLQILAPGLAVIGLTAHAMPADRARCLAAGMVDHIAKPMDPDALVATLLRHTAGMGGESNEPHDRDPLPAVSGAAAGTAGADCAPASQRLAETLEDLLQTAAQRSTTPSAQGVPASVP